MNSDETVFYLSAHFSGHVQGVGFRYSTKQLANGFEVAGFVKNLVDGRVELEVEGVESECHRFVREVESELDSFIKDTDVRTGKRTRLYTQFGIR